MKSDSLDAYRKKRDFGVTAEPRGKVARPGKALAFVVQKHAASRLHYDLRLELDGTLKSWAVPKGPSLDPKVRRMAVRVEDHPVSYGTFEGVIPKGQYGAGTVIVWDRGTWASVGDPREGYSAGKLKFTMQGEKLRGGWTLVRMRGKAGERQEPWLLIKEDDGEARPASEFDVVEEQPDSVMKGKARATKRTRRSDALPEGAVAAKLPLALHPQLATLVDKPPCGAGWTYEVKFDGYRLLARIEGDDVRLFTRNGHDWTSRLKELAADVRSLGLGAAWLDGEIVMLDAHGNPDFQALQNAFDTSKTRDIVYFVFDMPHAGGHDLTRVPLAERRRRLEGALAGRKAARIRFSESFDAPVAKLLESACRKGLEGLIGKRSDAPYASRRSPTWIKLKCTRRQEFVVAGYTEPKGSRVGFGALLLGVHDAAGRLTYAGNVGTGFDDKLLAALLARLRALETARSPFDAPPRGVKAHWVRPKLVAEVAFTEWTGEGRIRHPVFHGLRADKEPRRITREEAKPAAAAPEKSAHAAPGIKVTHADRVIDPKSRATKGDLVGYYERVAAHMLPHLVRRPVALVRGPTGVGGELFFQKHGEKLGIPGIRTLDPSLWPGHAAMIEVDTAQALVGAAQMNVIEFHTWNSTTKAIGKPDRVIFDLDPGEGIGWGTLQEATAVTHKMLELLGLASFLKTSGGKGLHVVVPLKPKWDYDAVKDFSEAVVKHLAATLPRLFVSKSGPRNRVGRIFVDYLRNGRGATTAAAFSARARPGMGVSVPVAWKELSSLEGADQWNIFTIGERLALRADPWKEYEPSRQTLDAAFRKLARE